MIRKRTLREWSAVFGITLEDLDGFPRIRDNELASWGTLVSLEEFAAGVVSCCVRWDNVERYKVLDDLIS
jgi:hypothetical protein